MIHLAPGETAASIAAASVKKKARFIDPPVDETIQGKAKLYPKKFGCGATRC